MRGIAEQNLIGTTKYDVALQVDGAVTGQLPFVRFGFDALGIQGGDVVGDIGAAAEIR